MSEQTKGSVKKPVQLWLMLILDVLLLAVCLLSFAYFHHVRPRADVNPAAVSTDSGRHSEDFMKQAGDTAGSKPGFGAKWEDCFTDGAPVITENSYQSRDISVQISDKQVGNSVYYIADIHIRYTNNLRSAFGSTDENGEDKYMLGKPSLAPASEIIRRVNAVVAVNGDYYGARENGYLFRNFKLYRDMPRADVGALYADGTFRNFEKNAFDLQNEIANGLYQTMGFEPTLVTGGKALTGYNGSIASANPRSGFGYYEPGHYCIAVADGRQEGYSVGPTIDEFAAFFESLGVQEAYNLDGGKSSQLYFMGRLVNRPDGYDGTERSLRTLTDMFYIGEVE
jgi:exopolysaccharide biosynthesis protein